MIAKPVMPWHGHPIVAMNFFAMDGMSMEELNEMGHDVLHEDHMSDDRYEAYDDVSNEELIPSMVRAARSEELDYFKAMKL